MMNEQAIASLVDESFLGLEAYVKKEQFKGWDPYDGLNSTLFQSIPGIRSSRFFRLVWIQLFKKNPVNLRRLAGVKKEYNSKGIGLFLHSYCLLYKITGEQEHLHKINELGDLLLTLRSKGWKGDCWGYNFDWQARAFYQPRYTPTVVASVYCASALAEAYQITGKEPYLQAVISCGDFVLKDLQRSYDETGDFCFSYSPLDTSKVFNASLLGAKLLSLLYRLTGKQEYKEIARKAVSYCCRRQHADGSWVYGEQSFHQWIDNFHTGFNLECLSHYQANTGDRSFEAAIQKGFDYYINTFFTQEGISKYYNNRLYPVDIHAPAQLIVTLFQLNLHKEHRMLCDKVMNWTIQHMQDKQGYFYYQVKKSVVSKIPYMRWAQAWMFYALSTYKLAYHEN